ncbi:FAD-dependent oxidoreductase [Pseudonocardia sp. N23]|uniref:FAD-dependent oxidoreductase n=1 Tax=Pseudonocardia sp. N23 TaxID=1987376 RepID=UPI000BFCC922|nr:FAD-dependent oxidoreductase [Pseudonocardia sp. N23]
MPRKTVIIGGGPAGTGAAGGVKAVDPSAEVVLYTQFEDIAYSPCGIPYVHGGEIDSFDRLILAGKQAYVDAGIDVHYESTVTSINTAKKTITVKGEGEVSYDSLVIGTGFAYADPGVPGTDLGGLYYVKNIRAAQEWDKVIANSKRAVVVEASPLAMEMVTALAHRGIETHLIDPNPYALSNMADADIMAPVEESFRELGIHLHFNTTLEAFLGDSEGKLRAIKTSAGEIPVDLAVVATHKTPNNALAAAAGIKIGSTGGLVVDENMKTSAPDVWAAGDACEIPHGLAGTPLQGLTGSHAYAQGKTAGQNAGGGSKAYRTVFIPWGTPAGKWVIGGASFGEATATALGIPYIVGVAEGVSRSRYYSGVKKTKLKILADPKSHKILGAQMVGGGDGIKERADFLAQAIRFGMTLEDLATMESVFSPAIGALTEPIVAAANNGLAAAKKG